MKNCRIVKLKFQFLLGYFSLINISKKRGYYFLSYLNFFQLFFKTHRKLVLQINESFFNIYS